MAVIGLGNAGGKAVLWRNLFSSNQCTWKTGVSGCITTDFIGLEGEEWGGVGLGGGVSGPDTGFGSRNGRRTDLGCG